MEQSHDHGKWRKVSFAYHHTGAAGQPARGGGGNESGDLQRDHLRGTALATGLAALAGAAARQLQPVRLVLRRGLHLPDSTANA